MGLPIGTLLSGLPRRIMTTAVSLYAVSGSGCSPSPPCSDLEGVPEDVCKLENADPPPERYPDEKRLSDAQKNLREEIKSGYGVRIADGGCEPDGYINEQELRRFATILEGYHQVGLVRDKLEVIQVGSAPADWENGGRPMAFAGYRTIVFYCNTSGAVPYGSVFDDVFSLMFYFSHEHGHVLTLDANSGKTLQDTLLGYYYQSEPGYLSPNWELNGDFISEYAETNALEDVAVTFRFSTYSDYFPYGFEMAMTSIFKNSPILSAKVLTNLEFAATETDARVLVWMTPEGKLFDFQDCYDYDNNVYTCNRDLLTLNYMELPISRDARGNIETVMLPSGDILERPKKP